MTDQEKARGMVQNPLNNLVIFQPKPDPLVITEYDDGTWEINEDRRAALEARGLEIREQSK
jgi:hypothetical protein